jgi:hypothetical protein
MCRDHRHYLAIMTSILLQLCSVSHSMIAATSSPEAAARAPIWFWLAADIDAGCRLLLS